MLTLVSSTANSKAEIPIDVSWLPPSNFRDTKDSKFAKASNSIDWIFGGMEIDVSPDPSKANVLIDSTWLGRSKSTVLNSAQLANALMATNVSLAAMTTWPLASTHEHSLHVLKVGAIVGAKEGDADVGAMVGGIQPSNASTRAPHELHVA
jgi:hypothetical protein